MGWKRKCDGDGRAQASITHLGEPCLQEEATPLVHPELAKLHGTDKASHGSSGSHRTGLALGPCLSLQLGTEISTRVMSQANHGDEHRREDMDEESKRSNRYCLGRL